MGCGAPAGDRLNVSLWHMAEVLECAKLRPGLAVRPASAPYPGPKPLLRVHDIAGAGQSLIRPDGIRPEANSLGFDAISKSPNEVVRLEIALIGA